MEDHPEIDRRPQPSRGVEATLTPAQLAAFSLGDAVQLDEAALERLKVFDDEDNQLNLREVSKTEVACLECSGSGTYQCAELVVPKFGKAELMSFTCDSCGYKFNKTRAVARERTEGLEALPDGHGRRITLRVQSEKDLNREVVVSDGAFVRAGEVEASPRDGSLSTVEGVLRQIASKLGFLTIMSNTADGENAKAISSHVNGLIDDMIAKMKNGEPFDFVLEDEEDACHIEKFDADDTQVVFSSYLVDEVTEQDEDGQSPVLCSFLGPVPGTIVQAQYNDEWIYDCLIVGLQGVMVQVEKSSAPEEGRWLAGVDQIRGCDDPGCGCQTMSSALFGLDAQAQDDENALPAEAEEQSAKEAMEYLERFAQHVEVVENRAKEQYKKHENKETQRRLAQDFLETLD
mmetsp:Transcript_1246/g.1984  ORF Transcript_1246/g.1984 Transcript_1246/m.1984 type:complete len:403 (-) Transcript_1246:120-1328(-)